MKQKDTILQELSELKSTLANVAPQNIYSVPVGYFDELAAQILNRIKAIEASNAREELNYLSPLLSSIAKQMPYSVPAGYFEEHTEKAMLSVHKNKDYQTSKEELAALSPLLSGLKKQMPYSVPQGYFENLSGEADIKGNKQSIKVISITSRKWFRYVAAAVITGVIATAGFLLIGNKNETGGKALAEFTSDIKKMNDTQKDTLMNFIDAGMNGQETAQANIDSKTKANTDDKAKEIKDLLQGVSDQELKDFKEQTDDIQDVLMTN